MMLVQQSLEEMKSHVEVHWLGVGYVGMGRLIRWVCWLGILGSTVC